MLLLLPFNKIISYEYFGLKMLMEQAVCSMAVAQFTKAQCCSIYYGMSVCHLCLASAIGALYIGYDTCIFI